MQPIKLSNSVEFEVIYADGTRRRVTEGVLFEAKNQHMIFHKGTSRKSVMLATVAALAEVVKKMGLSEEARQYVEAESIRRRIFPNKETVIMHEQGTYKEIVCDKCGRDVTAEEYAKIQLWSPDRPEGGQNIDLCLGCYLKLMRFLQRED